MDNRDRTQENVNIIRKLYFNTKPAIISSVKKIVKETLQELEMDVIEQEYTTQKSVTFKEEITKQIVQEFDFFIEYRLKEDYTYNINSDYIFTNSSRYNEREREALEELEKLLNTAENIDQKKNSLSTKVDLISTIIIISLGAFIFLLIIVQPSTLTLSLCISSLLLGIYAIYNFFQIQKEYLKEKRALNKIVGIIQEVTPYHLRDMTVLAKANFEVRLARMNISVAGSDS